MFIPTTIEEVKARGWDALDCILISGDTYIDTYYNGAALIGKLLISRGYRTGIIAQPDTNTDADITRLGEPLLFWGVTGGSFDSMVANYTAVKKRRKSDDLTPGLANSRRPDRAVISYSNLIRKYYKSTAPVVIGGIEASLRRVAHYDYWDNKVRRSILFDSKADILIYGMGEKAVLELARALKDGVDYSAIRGICIKSKDPVDGYIALPPFEQAAVDREKFSDMFTAFYENNDPYSATGLYQKHGDRYLIQNPPQPDMDQKELDEVYNLNYERDVHPYYKNMGEVRALDTVRFSITTHRGCYGECNFCAIAVHQGRRVNSRSMASIEREVDHILEDPMFKGIISDIGGPTGNMYMTSCKTRKGKAMCKRKRCLYPHVCENLDVSHSAQLDLLKRISSKKGMKKVFVASGIRHDMINADREYGLAYLKEVLEKHTSGQMKIAPEHSSEKVLNAMGKPDFSELFEFKKNFDKINGNLKEKKFLTYYLIASHPGCTIEDMKGMREIFFKRLKLLPEQIQIFTPAPSTISTLAYYTGKDWASGREIFIERDNRKKEKQKDVFSKK